MSDILDKYHARYCACFADDSGHVQWRYCGKDFGLFIDDTLHWFPSATSITEVRIVDEKHNMTDQPAPSEVTARLRMRFWFSKTKSVGDQ